MPDKQLTTEHVLSILATTPPRIAELTAGLPTAILRSPPAPDEWSANDVLAHLRSCADVWGGCIEVILAEDEPTLRATNPTTWIKRTDYPALEFEPSLRAFTAQREALLSVLERLPAAAWERGATVSVAGKPYWRTVMFYARWMASHERPHLKQIQRTLVSLRGEQD